MSGTEAGLTSQVFRRRARARTTQGRFSSGEHHNPSAKAFPVDAAQRRLVLEAIRDAVYPYPPTPVYWLGDAYQGFGARALGRQAHASTFGYFVTSGRRMWVVDVVTSDPVIPPRAVTRRFAACRVPVLSACSHCEKTVASG